MVPIYYQVMKEAGLELDSYEEKQCLAMDLLEGICKEVCDEICVIVDDFLMVYHAHFSISFIFWLNNGLFPYFSL